MFLYKMRIKFSIYLILFDTINMLKGKMKNKNILTLYNYKVNKSKGKSYDCISIEKKK